MDERTERTRGADRAEDVDPRGGALDERAPVFVISVAAELSGMHPQTLRQYDRIGLVSPRRTAGRGRRYSSRDIARLRQVQQLSQSEGINLAGIKRILELEDQVQEMRERMLGIQQQMMARSLWPGGRELPRQLGRGTARDRTRVQTREQAREQVKEARERRIFAADRRGQVSAQLLGRG